MLARIIKTSRPILWLANWTSLIIGVAAAGESKLFCPGFFAAAFLLGFPYALFVYSINDYYDVKSDWLNPRKGTALGPKHETEFVRLLPRLSFLGFITTLVGLLFFGKEVIAVYFVTSLFLYFYSARPIRFKGIPVLDGLIGGGFFLTSGGLLGYLMFGQTISSLLTSFPIGFFVLFVAGTAIHLVGAALDIEPDKMEGTNTSAVFFGYKTIAVFCISISLLGILVVRQNLFYSLELFLAAVLAALLFFPIIRKSSLLKIVISETVVLFTFLVVFGIGLINLDLLR
ncbi:MAG: UbiA family prenyltransferase [Candidatus Pacebacteria bacterium]|nr:UbiA family prenyltransferase [Candidatus Paceibacterota bacterium]